MTSTVPRQRPDPASAPAVPTKSAPAVAGQRGRLDWHQLLGWLRDDGLVGADDAQHVIKRFGAGASSLHALVRLGGAGLQHQGLALDCEALTKWLAQRVQLPYLRIDPLKVDVGRVAEVMSLQYAEMRKVLPVKVEADAVTVATSEPFDTSWVAEIEAHSRRRVKRKTARTRLGVPPPGERMGHALAKQRGCLGKRGVDGHVCGRDCVEVVECRRQRG